MFLFGWQNKIYRFYCIWSLVVFVSVWSIVRTTHINVKCCHSYWLNDFVNVGCVWCVWVWNCPSVLYVCVGAKSSMKLNINKDKYSEWVSEYFVDRCWQINTNMYPNIFAASDFFFTLFFFFEWNEFQHKKHQKETLYALNAKCDLKHQVHLGSEHLSEPNESSWKFIQFFFLSWVRVSKL